MINGYWVLSPTWDIYITISRLKEHRGRGVGEGQNVGRNDGKPHLLNVTCLFTHGLIAAVATCARLSPPILLRQLGSSEWLLRRVSHFSWVTQAQINCPKPVSSKHPITVVGHPFPAKRHESRRGLVREKRVSERTEREMEIMIKVHYIAQNCERINNMLKLL